MTKRAPFKWFKTSPEINRLAVMLFVRFSLSLRNVEDVLHERRIDVGDEAVRFRWHRFGPMFAAEIRKRRIEGMRSSHWRWHLDTSFPRFNGERFRGGNNERSGWLPVALEAVGIPNQKRR